MERHQDAQTGELSMDREELGRLLSGGGEERRLARAALARGAAYEIWPERVSAANLFAVYRRRERTTRRAGQPIIGFETALKDLEDHQEVSVLLGQIDDRPAAGYLFQLFLASDATHIIACLGVKPSNRER